MFYALVFFEGEIVGSARYSDEPDSYPENQIPCTKEQHDNWGQWKISGGELVPQDQAVLIAKGKVKSW